MLNVTVNYIFPRRKVWLVVSTVNISKKLAKALTYCLLGFYYLFFLPINYTGRFLFTFYYMLDYHSQYGNILKRIITLPFFLALSSSLSLVAASIFMIPYFALPMLNLIFHLIKIPLLWAQGHPLDQIPNQLVNQQIEILNLFQTPLNYISNYFFNPRLLSFEESRFSHISIWRFTKTPQILLKSLIFFINTDHKLNEKNHNSIIDLLVRSDMGLNVIEVIDSLSKYLKSVFADQQEQPLDINEITELPAEERIGLTAGQIAAKIARQNRLKRLGLPLDSKKDLNLSKLTIKKLYSKFHSSLGLGYYDLKILFISIASFADYLKLVLPNIPALINQIFVKIDPSFEEVLNSTNNSIIAINERHRQEIINCLFNPSFLKNGLKNIQSLSNYFYSFYKFQKFPSKFIADFFNNYLKEIFKKINDYSSFLLAMKRNHAADLREPLNEIIEQRVYLIGNETIDSLSIDSRFIESIVKYTSDHGLQTISVWEDFLNTEGYLKKLNIVLPIMFLMGSYTLIRFNDPSPEARTSKELQHLFIQHYLSEGQAEEEWPALFKNENFLDFLKKIPQDIINRFQSTDPAIFEPSIINSYCQKFTSFINVYYNFDLNQQQQDLIQESLCTSLIGIRFHNDEFNHQIKMRFTLADDTPSISILNLIDPQLEITASEFLSNSLLILMNSLKESTDFIPVFHINADENLMARIANSCDKLCSPIRDELSPLTIPNILPGSILSLLILGLIHDHYLGRNRNYETLYTEIKNHLINLGSSQNDIFKSIRKRKTMSLVEKSINQLLSNNEQHFTARMNHLVELLQILSPQFVLQRSHVHHAISRFPLILGTAFEKSDKNFEASIQSILKKKDPLVLVSEFSRVIVHGVDFSQSMIQAMRPEISTYQRAIYHLNQIYSVIPPALIEPIRCYYPIFSIISTIQSTPVIGRELQRIIPPYNPEQIQKLSDPILSSVLITNELSRVILPMAGLFVFQRSFQVLWLYGLVNIASNGLQNKALCRKLGIYESTAKNTADFLSNINIWSLIIPVLLFNIYIGRSLSFIQNPFNFQFLYGLLFLYELQILKELAFPKGQNYLPDNINEFLGDFASSIGHDISLKLINDTESIFSCTKALTFEEQPADLSDKILGCIDINEPIKKSLLTRNLSLLKQETCTDYRLISSLYKNKNLNHFRYQISAFIHEKMNAQETGLILRTLKQIAGELRAYYISELRKEYRWPTQPSLFTDREFNDPSIDRLLTDLFMSKNSKNTNDFFSTLTKIQRAFFK